MGRWDNSGRNYGKGLEGKDHEESEKIRKFRLIAHCKKCIHRDLNEKEPLKSNCKITKLLCLEAIPICRFWQFKETPTKQTIYVAKHQD